MCFSDLKTEAPKTEWGKPPQIDRERKFLDRVKSILALLNNPQQGDRAQQRLTTLLKFATKNEAALSDAELESRREALQLIVDNIAASVFLPPGAYGDSTMLIFSWPKGFR